MMHSEFNIKNYLLLVRTKELPIIPLRYSDALRSKYSKEWKIAMDEEINLMFKNDVFQIVDYNNQNLINTAFVFNYKDKESKFTARLVARGDYQTPDMYTSTYSPTMDFSILRLLLAISLNLNLTVWNVDVQRAFLNAKLEEDIYIRPPAILNLSLKYCIKLNKALYGLKQASHQWFKELSKFLFSIGFINLLREKIIFVHKDIRKLILGIYVDDIIILAPNAEVKNWFTSKLSNKFPIHDRGLLSELLNVKITRTNNDFIYNQEDQINKLCDQFYIRSDDRIRTPLISNDLIKKHENSESCNSEEYSSLIGSMLYIARITRPDILFPIIQLSQFRESPKLIHMKKLLRILIYLRNTAHYQLTIFKSNLNLTVYSDANFATNYDYKSFEGLLVMVGNSIIKWSSHKMNLTAQSTDESEIVSANSSLRELMYFKYLFEELKDKIIDLNDPQIPILFLDNTSSISFCEQGFGKRTKYLATKYIYLHEQFLDKSYLVKYVNTKENLADIFTKNVTKDILDLFLQKVNFKV